MAGQHGRWIEQQYARLMQQIGLPATESSVTATSDSCVRDDALGQHRRWDEQQ